MTESSASKKEPPAKEATEKVFTYKEGTVPSFLRRLYLFYVYLKLHGERVGNPMFQPQISFAFSPYTALYDLVVPKDNMLRQINELVDFSFI